MTATFQSVGKVTLYKPRAHFEIKGLLVVNVYRQGMISENQAEGMVVETPVALTLP